MNFLKRLFKKESDRVEYVESRSHATEVDIQTLSKPEVQSFLSENLEADYWKENSPVITNELLKITSTQDISDRLALLEQCLTATTQGLFLEVMDHYDTFLTGLENVQNINTLLEQSQNIASDSRVEVMAMQNELKKKLLRISYLQKRQTRLLGLISELKNFEDICFTVSLSIKQAINSGNLFHALELCNEATVYLNTFEVSKYKALAGILEVAEKRKGKIYVKMKGALRDLCFKFDSNLYENVLLSYMTISSYDDINKAIQAEFMHSISRLIKESIEHEVPQVSSWSIENMLKVTPAEKFIPTIRIIYKKLTNLMYNHHLLSRWHEENDMNEENSYKVTSKFIKDPEKIQEIKGFYVEIKINLLKNRKFIWEKVQQSLAKIFAESDQINAFSQGEIRSLLSLTNTFIEIGEDFSGMVCQEVRSVIALKCKLFFVPFHLSHLTRIVNLLEAEQWTRLPIPKDFELLSELKKNAVKLHSLSALIESFNMYSFSFSKLVQGNPFDEGSNQVQFNPEDESARVSFSGIKQIENSPVLCTTGMNILKSASSYIELINILTPISGEVLRALWQLFELFFFEVFRIFGQDSSKNQLFVEVTDREASGEQLDGLFETFLFQKKYKSLRVHMQRIKNSIETLPNDCSFTIKQLHKSGTTQASLAKAIIAIQSCKNILNALQGVQDYLESSMSALQAVPIEEFLSEAKAIIDELESFTIIPFVAKTLNIDWLAGLITNSRWDEKREEDNLFVSRLIYHLNDFKEKLSCLGGGSIPEYLQHKLLARAAELCNEQIIEGISRVKRCNQSGRDQMKKDFKSFNIAIKEIIIIDKPVVWEEYLEIWSGSAEGISEWVTSNSHINLKLHRGLLQTAPAIQSMQKSQRNLLFTNIESSYKGLIFS